MRFGVAAAGLGVRDSGLDSIARTKRVVCHGHRLVPMDLRN